MPLMRNDYVFFWHETSENGWASQWYQSSFRARIHLELQLPAGSGPDAQSQSHTVIVDSEREYSFPTAEHWMMGCKALLFGDTEVFHMILESDPRDARGVKALGRAVRGFDEAQWNAARSPVVVQGNLHKFRQNRELKDALLGTGSRTLVEASPRDRVWGIGFGEKRALEMRESWGLNLLGKALEEVREILRKEEGERDERKDGDGGPGSPDRERRPYSSSSGNAGVSAFQERERRPYALRPRTRKNWKA